MSAAIVRPFPLLWTPPRLRLPSLTELFAGGMKRSAHGGGCRTPSTGGGQRCCPLYIQFKKCSDDSDTTLWTALVGGQAFIPSYGYDNLTAYISKSGVRYYAGPENNTSSTPPGGATAIDGTYARETSCSSCSTCSPKSPVWVDVTISGTAQSPFWPFDPSDIPATVDGTYRLRQDYNIFGVGGSFLQHCFWGYADSSIRMYAQRSSTDWTFYIDVYDVDAESPGDASWLNWGTGTVSATGGDCAASASVDIHTIDFVGDDNGSALITPE